MGMRELPEADFVQAKAARAERMQGPLAASATYDAGRNRIVIALTTGIEIAFVPEQVQGLAGASADDLRDVVLRSGGLSIHWPRLDADFSVPNLLQGLTGTKRWMAAQLVAAGGKVPSEAKAKAARENGKRGGRRAVQASA
jgi:hypothetical protein